MNSKVVNDAIKVFVYGVGVTRSFTHPYVHERIDPLWVMRDAPRKSGRYRNEEWVAYGVDPVEIDEIVRKQAQNKFSICAVLDNSESDKDLRAAFKEMGYQLIRTEPFMIHNLEQIPQREDPVREDPVQIVRVEDEVMADKVNKAARVRQILPKHLAFEDLLQSPLRQYAALVDDEVVGRVKSVMLHREDGNHATWVDNMYVWPDFRRRGIASALMSCMLRDDKAAGAKQSVLLATHTGAKLYPVLGYEQIGMLYIYTPQKR